MFIRNPQRICQLDTLAPMRGYLMTFKCLRKYTELTIPRLNFPYSTLLSNCATCMPASMYECTGLVWLTYLMCKHRWFSGRMLACHAGGPGSIPGRCKVFPPHPYLVHVFHIKIMLPLVVRMAERSKAPDSRLSP